MMHSPASGIAAQLLGGEEYRYSFFQAVRLVDLMFAAEPQQRTGHGNTPFAEPLRFRTRASLAFPASELYALGFDPEDAQQFDPHSKQPRNLAWQEPRLPLEMTLNFFGLFGPKGVLPLHYAELVHRRIRLGDSAMRDFFDMLSHRLVAFFYRAWAKHHPAVGYEWSEQRRNQQPEGESAARGLVDDFTRYVLSLIGLGQPTLQGRMAVDDESFMYYAGLLAELRRPALSLAGLVRDYFELNPSQVRITQFVPQVLPLPPSEQSQVGDWNCELGISTVLGDEALLEGSKFEIVLGPFFLVLFRRFLPMQEQHNTGDGFRRLVQLTRFFVGPEFDFDIRLVLKKESAYQCGIGSSADTGAIVGVAAWLLNELPPTDLADSVFPSTLAE